MKLTHRLLALFLSVCLTTSALPLSALAAEASADSVSVSEAAEGTEEALSAVSADDSDDPEAPEQTEEPEETEETVPVAEVPEEIDLPDISAQPETEPEASEAAAQSDAEPETSEAAAQSDAEPEASEAAAQSDAEPEASEAAAQSDAEPEASEAAVQSDAEATEPMTPPDGEAPVSEAPVEEEPIQEDGGNSWRYHNGQPIDDESPMTYAAPSTKGVTAKGIDVSKWNGTINWAKVRNAGIQYAILRCGYTGQTSGKQNTDEKWYTYVKGCQSAGMPFGAYYYSVATSTNIAKKEATAVLAQLKNAGLTSMDFPIYYDLEDAKTAKKSSSTIAAIARAFCSTIEAYNKAHGTTFRVGIYANVDWWKVHLNTFSYSGCYIWVAHWASSSGYSKPYTMWQYSDKGRVNGISSTYTDLNYWYGSFPTGMKDTANLSGIVPTVTSVTNVFGGVSVKWNAVKSATSYRVYRKTSASGWTALKTVTGTTYTDTSATSGGTYSYTVQAINRSSVSSYNTTGKTLFYLASPRIFAATNYANSIKVVWNPIRLTHHYVVYRRPVGGSWAVLATTTNTYYFNLSAVPGTAYEYSVRAATRGGALSGFYTAGFPIRRLAAPALKTVANGRTGVDVSWKASAGATSYQIYRKTASSGWSAVGTSATTSFADHTAVTGKVYSYTVQAMRGTVKSTYNTKGLSVHYLAAPALPAMANLSKGIYLRWTPVANAQRYILYRKTTNSGWTTLAVVSNTGYLDTTANVGVTYIYTLRAVDSGRLSAYRIGKQITRQLGTTLSSVSNSAANALALKWKLVNGITGYQIQYATNSAFSSPSYTTVGKTVTTKTLTNLVKGKTYYARVRTYCTVNGVTTYSAWTVAKSAKITK